MLEQQEDNPSGTETAEEIEPTMHSDEQAEQAEVNEDIEDDAEDDEEEDDVEDEVDDAASEADDVNVQIDADEVQLGDRLSERRGSAEEEPATGES